MSLILLYCNQLAYNNTIAGGGGGTVSYNSGINHRGCRNGRLQQRASVWARITLAFLDYIILFWNIVHLLVLEEIQGVALESSPLDRIRSFWDRFYMTKGTHFT